MGTFNNQAANAAPVGRVLVVAALGRELAALKRAAEPRLALLETGEGTENAERAVRAWLDAETPRIVLGIGFAGALSQLLEVGDLLVARESRSVGSEAFKAIPSLLEAAGRIDGDGVVARFGVTQTVDQVVCKAQGKSRLAMALAPGEIGCVDMESSAIARVCAERGVPFLVARCITDLFTEDLPVDFNRCRRADGRISNWKVLTSALMRPASFKALLELRQRSMLCSEKLATFVRLLVAEIDRSGSDG
jgi:adenosylhomocysteine nucleosidase